MNRYLNWMWPTPVVMAALITAMLLFPVRAQQPVATQPYVGATTQNGSSTITTGVSGAFQSVFVQTGKLSNPSTNQFRVACTVQNNSATNPMYVFFGPIAVATTATAVKLSSGQSVNCTVGGITLQDQVSVSGTSGDAFYAAQQ